MSFIPRYIVDLTNSTPEAVAGSSLEIAGDEFHHLTRGHRLSAGDEAEVLVRPAMRVFKATLTEITRTRATALLGLELPLISTPEAHLICGIIDLRLCDQIIDQCVQLGVTSISFFTAERSQRAQRFERLNRWTRVADSSLKQSGFHDFRGVSLYPSLVESLEARHCHQGENPTQRRVLFCPPPLEEKTLNVLSPLPHRTSDSDTSPDYPHPSFTLGNLGLQSMTQNAESYLIVGPEGGLTEREHDTAAHFNYRRASLGLKTFRTETAAVLCSALFLLRL